MNGEERFYDRVNWELEKSEVQNLLSFVFSYCYSQLNQVVAWNLKTPLIIWPSWQPLFLLYISVTK